MEVDPGRHFRASTANPASSSRRVPAAQGVGRLAQIGARLEFVCRLTVFIAVDFGGGDDVPERHVLYAAGDPDEESDARVEKVNGTLCLLGGGFVPRPYFNNSDIPRFAVRLEATALVNSPPRVRLLPHAPKV